jgi:hypothetical protein
MNLLFVTNVETIETNLEFYFWRKEIPYSENYERKMKQYL